MSRRKSNDGSTSKVRRKGRNPTQTNPNASTQAVVKVSGNFTLSEIKPLTDNQDRVFDAYLNDKHLVLSGFPGTGKTFLSMYLALQAVFNENLYDKLLIVRSAVSSRSQGFLPGSEKEKSKIYELPYKQICNDLFKRGDAYEVMKSKGIIEFTTTSFLRGLTFDNTIILVDETQNLTTHEIDTIMTRIGDNTRIIFSGDFNQTDLDGVKEFSGIRDLISIVKRMDAFEIINFEIDDIVRSGIVKSYIIAREKYKESRRIAGF